MSLAVAIGFAMLTGAVSFVLGSLFTAGREARRGMSTSDWPPAQKGAAPSSVTRPDAGSHCKCGHVGFSHDQRDPYACNYHGCDCPSFQRRATEPSRDA